MGYKYKWDTNIWWLLLQLCLPTLGLFCDMSLGWTEVQDTELQRTSWESGRFFWGAGIQWKWSGMGMTFMENPQGFTKRQEVSNSTGYTGKNSEYSFFPLAWILQSIYYSGRDNHLAQNGWVAWVWTLPQMIMNGEQLWRQGGAKGQRQEMGTGGGHMEPKAQARL